MNGMRKMGGLAVVALAVTLQAAPAHAQEKAATAAGLEEKAEAYAADVGGFDEAASLFREAAGLRLEGDPQGIRDLLQAGHLAYYAGDVRRAAADLARAGRIAHEYGDVVTAAKAFFDAAWAADQAGDGAQAYDFATRAQRLAQSPLIAHEQRTQLLARIDIRSSATSQ